jgi:hypothetical protein
MQGVDMDMDIDLHMNVDLHIDILHMDTGSWTCKWTWTASARRGHGHTDSLKRRGDRNLVLEKTVGDQSGSFSRRRPAGEEGLASHAFLFQQLMHLTTPPLVVREV